MLALMSWETYNTRNGEAYTLETLPKPRLNVSDKTPLEVSSNLTLSCTLTDVDGF